MGQRQSSDGLGGATLKPSPLWVRGRLVGRTSVSIDGWMSVGRWEAFTFYSGGGAFFGRRGLWVYPPSKISFENILGKVEGDMFETTWMTT